MARFLKVAAAMLLLAAGVEAQAPAALEAQLPQLRGVERARVLARLVDAYKFDRPTQSIAYGREALELLDAAPDSAAHVLTLSELGWAYMQLSRFDEAVAAADSARRLAAQTGQRRGEARAISNLGTIAQRRGDPERAIELFTEALAIQRALGSALEIANSLNNIGFVYSTDLAKYPEALAQHLEALKLREALGDSSAISLSLNNIGVVYGRLRQYAHATRYFERALAMRRQLGNQTRVAGTLNNLGDMYMESGKPARALPIYREALALREKAGDPAAVSMSHRTVALSHLALGQLPQALASMSLAEKAGEGLEDRGLQVGNLLARSEIDRRQELADNAARNADRALEIARGMGSRELVRRSLEALAAAQEDSKRHVEALRTLKSARAVSDSIYDATTARRITQLEGRYAEERRGHEVARLRRDQAESELRAERQASQRNAVIAIAGVLGLFGLLLYRRRIEHSRLAQDLSITDPLTLTRNRRFAEQTMDADVAVSARRHLRAAQRGEPPEEADIVYLMLDLDRFKDVNDKYGHAAGDLVLRGVVAALTETSRQSDVIIRWGGEEFLVVGRFTDRALAGVHAQRLREAVESRITRIDSRTSVRVTCSVGYAAYPLLPQNPDANTWMQVVALADQASYIAKERGRNRCAGLFAAAGLAAIESETITRAFVTTAVADGALVLEDDVSRGVSVPASSAGLAPS